MDGKNELKSIVINNRLLCHIDDTIQDIDISFSNILLDKKLYETMSVYDVSHKTSTGQKPLHIRFDKIDEFARAYAGELRYLIMFHLIKLNLIMDYLITFEKRLNIL